MRKVCVGIHTYAEPARLHATLDSLRAHTPHGVGLLLLGDGADDATRDLLARLSDLPQSNTDDARGAPACFNRLVASARADVFVFLEDGARVGPGWLERLLAALDADPRHGLAGPSTNFCWNEQAAAPRAEGSPRGVERAAAQLARLHGDAVRTLEPLHSLADFCYAVRRETIEAVGAADESYGLGPCWEMDYNVRAARAGLRGVWACAAYVHRAPFTARRRGDEAALFEVNKRLYQDKFCGGRLRGEKPDYRPHCRGDACPDFAPPALIRIFQPLRHAGASEHTPPDAPDVPAPTPTAPTPAPEETTRRVTPPVEFAPEMDTPAPSPPAWPHVESASTPLVSCIMPTFDRRAFVPQAVRYFLRQNYPHTELVVVDDGTDKIADLLPADPRVRYVAVEGKLTIGAKRNLACERARGEFIVHWDDDDWYPPWRVRAQVRALVETGAEVCGTSRLFYFDAAAGHAWRYCYARASRPWVAGNSLAYRKSFWERHRFADVQVGEDARFVWGAARGAVCDLDEPSLCVGTVHPTNTSPKETGGDFWKPEPFATVHALLGEDLAFYAAAPDAESYPLVSCIMPTFNRRAFIPLALEAFRRQDYPRKELVVVDDGTDPIADLLEGAEDVRHLRLERRATIGGKRNLACRHARGPIIAHWDDDDWYAPARLRYQVEPILAGKADVTGLVNSFVMELPGGLFWTTLPHLHPRLFVGDVHGGTLVFSRSLLAEGVRYPEANLAEDAALLQQAVRRGKRLLRLENPGLFIYVRHGRNAWREFAPGSFIDPDGWATVDPPPELPPSVLDSYKQAALTSAR